jgi:hypothetical protein
MPIPQLSLCLHFVPSPPSADGTITLDRDVQLQIETLISQHVPAMSASFSIASVAVICGGFTNR